MDLRGHKEDSVGFRRVFWALLHSTETLWSNFGALLETRRLVNFIEGQDIKRGDRKRLFHEAGVIQANFGILHKGRGLEGDIEGQGKRKGRVLLIGIEVDFSISEGKSVLYDVSF